MNVALKNFSFSNIKFYICKRIKLLESNSQFKNGADI